MTGRVTLFKKPLLRAAPIAIVCAMVAATFDGHLLAESKREPADRVPITISADFSQAWDDPEGHIAILRGRCRIEQGTTVLQAQKMVIWRSTESAGRGKTDRLTVYLEDDVRIEEPGSTYNESPTIARLGTHAGVTVTVRNLDARPAREDSLYARADDRRRKSTARVIRTTELAESTEEPPELRVEQFQPTPGNIRRIRIRPRSGNEFNIISFRAPNRTPPEQITVITGGVSVLIEGVQQTIEGRPIGIVDLSADRMVIWSRSEIVGTGSEAVVQSQDEPFEVYMEGNIVIFQGDPATPTLQRVVHACYATFDARDNKALLLKAELRTYIPSLRGDLRVFAERIQQLGPSAFHAKDAWISPSPYGKPGYRVQASDVFLEERFRSSTFGGVPPTINPATGTPEEETQNWVTGINNVFYVDDVPVFYLPYISVPADNSQMPLQNVILGQDSIFGTQIKTQWDLAKLLGWTPRPGQQWSLLAQYLSRRGPAVGVTGKYKGTNLFGVPGTYKGEVIGFYIHDDGTDNLGLDRRSLIPPNENRERAEWRHYQTLPDGWTVIGELGYVSDRNFLEEYYQHEFLTGKDVETVLYAKNQQGNWAASVMTTPELDNFEYNTEWLPRGDLYGLGEPLFDGWITWTSHSMGSYAIQHAADGPTDPADLFRPIPYMPNVQGAVAMTRHELDAPFNIGPIRVVPFAMGEEAYWGEGIDGNPINRLAIAGGFRSTLEMTRAFPEVQSDILGLNGLAHRILFEAGYRITEVNQNLDQIAQYNEINDNAQERFQERLIVNTWGGVVPPQFEPRFYAVRTGAGDYVTAPWYELLDDQQVFRFAIRQRLQTKEGPPDQQRTRDWMTLDVEASYFPDPGRDNFGAPWGLLTARYAWNVSPKTSIVANGLFDFFTDAEQLVNVGIISQRSERGSVYLGLVSIRGENQINGTSLNSDVLNASYSYQMSTKWISTLGASYDLGEHRNAGESLIITRVGLDFLFHAGFNYDPSTGSVGVAVSVEPKIGAQNNPMLQMSNLLSGQRMP